MASTRAKRLLNGSGRDKKNIKQMMTIHNLKIIIKGWVGMKLFRNLAFATFTLVCGFSIQNLEATTPEEICTISKYQGGMLVVNGSDDMVLLSH